MNKIFEDAKDVHVRRTYVYVSDHVADAYAYADNDCTVKIDCATLKDMFDKGAIVIDPDGMECIPAAFLIGPNHVGVLRYIAEAEGTTDAVLVKIYSSEYVHTP